MSPTEQWARETARSLVTVYLDTEDDLDLEAMIGECIGSASAEQIGELLYVLVMTVGDIFDDLQDFSSSVLNALSKGDES